MHKLAMLLGVAAVSIVGFSGDLRAERKALASEVTDASATESMAGWNSHYVPSLAVSDDAKVGSRSLVGTYGFTQNAIYRAGDGKTWDLTGYAKMRFWAKADRNSDNLLVMLICGGFKNRRDAVVALTTEWKLHELSFDLRTFSKNAQGDFSLSRVASVAFYNNISAEMKIWIDGLEFVRPAPVRNIEPESFSRDPTTMKAWTFVGNCSRAETKGLDAAATCLAIEGCGYAESPRVEVTPGNRYSVAGWGTTEGDWQNNSLVKVKWYDKAGTPIWWEFIRRDSFTKQWRKYEKVVIVPADAKYGAIVCHAQADWGKRSYFTQVGMMAAKPSPLLWDIHFDHLDDGWINDRSVYGNDGKAYCLSLDDLMVSQSGGAISFNNRKAKARFFHSKSISPAAHDEWVLVMQFFLEQPVAPRDEVPENAAFNLLGARWNTSIAYAKEGKKGTLVTQFYAYNPDGSATHPTIKLPIEPWKWYRLTLIVNNAGRKIEARLLKDGNEASRGAAAIAAGSLADPPFLIVGPVDYPIGGNAPYPWGFWGRMDYIKVYDSVAAYEADLKNIVFAGFGRP